jgi:hypothetical protein
MHRRLLTVCLLLVPVALAACGGDDNKSDNAATTPTVATAPTGPTAATGGTGEDGSSSKRSRKRRQSNSNGTGGARNLTPQNSKKQAERVRRALERSRKEVKKQERKAKEIAKKVPASQEKINSGGEAFRTAKTVCGSFLPDTYIEGQSKDDIAKSYAQPWPKAYRDDAYKGCREGLDQERAPSPPAD